MLDHLLDVMMEQKLGLDLDCQWDVMLGMVLGMHLVWEKVAEMAEGSGRQSAMVLALVLGMRSV